jgi:predicted unusual protein kinase regulating ubiquinone biosynthesis (AarF/ABC1/UbiB family)
MLDNFMDKSFESQSINEITDDLYDIAYNQPFRFPATFTFVMRAFSTIEGVGKGLDPEFNFMAVAQPFAMQLVSTGNNGETVNSIFHEISNKAAQVGSTAFGLPQRIEGTLDKLELGDIRVRVRAAETDRLLRRMTTTQMSTNYALFASTFTVCATLLFIKGEMTLAIIVIILAVVMAISFLRLLRRIDRLDRMG